MIGVIAVGLTVVFLHYPGLRPSADVADLDAQLATAKQFFDQENYAKAADLYKVLADQSPNDPTIPEYWMASELNLRQYDRAQKIGQDYLTKNGPITAQFLTVYGNTLHILGRADEALAQYRRAHERAPQDITAGLDLADLLVEQKQYDEAQTVADSITMHDVPITQENDPNFWDDMNVGKRTISVKVEQPLVYYMLARIADLKGNTDQADQYRDQAKHYESVK